MIKKIFLTITAILILLGAQQPEQRLSTLADPVERLGTLSLLTKQLMISNPDKAFKYGKEALQILQDHPDEGLKISVLNSLCWTCTMLELYDEALELGKKAEALAEKEKDKKSLAFSATAIANVYDALSQYEKALKYFIKALTLFEELNDEITVARGKLNLGNAYLKLKEYQKAYENYTQSLEIARKNGQKGDIAQVLNSIGSYHLYLGNYRESHTCFLQVLKLYREENNTTGIARALSNLALNRRKSGSFAEAIQYDTQALKLAQTTGSKSMIAHIYGSIALNFLHLKNYAKALENVKHAMKTIATVDSPDTKRQLYKILVDIHEARKDYSNALLWHKKYMAQQNLITNQKKNKAIARLQVSYEVDKKNKENALLKKNSRINALQRNLFILVSILILIIALVIYYRYRIKKKTETILRRSQQSLKRMNRTKDKLFTIVAHDLGSPINTLKLTAGHLENHFGVLDQDEIKEFIHHMYKQTDNMAGLLENLLKWALTQIDKLKQNPETIDLHLLAQETLEKAGGIAQKKEIQISSSINKNTLAWADKEMIITVLRNLVGNAVKYTRPGGRIRVTANQTDRQVEIVVEDNGVGIARDKLNDLFKNEVNDSTRGTANEKGTGLGLVLCKELVERNNGAIGVESEPDRGSRFRVTLPKHKPVPE